jgi:plasmid maintenance system antidote protein VapI
MLRNTPKLTHAQEAVTLRTGRPVGELLREMHVDQGLSQGAIGDALGVSRNTVAMWLREFGITQAEPPVELPA